MYEEDRELERLKREKLRRLMAQQEAQRRMQEAMVQAEKEAEIEAMKKYILLRYVDRDVRERIYNIRSVNPQLAEKIEAYIFALIQSRRVDRIDFELFKRIIESIRGK